MTLKTFLSSARDFHWIVWRLVSWSYSEIRDSSLVLTLRRQTFFCLKTLNNILMHLDAALLFISAVMALFFPDFMYAQIFGDNLNTVIFMSNTLVMLRRVNWGFPHPPALTIRRWPALWKPPDCFIPPFHLTLKLLCHSKTLMRYIELSPYICLSISSALVQFSPIDSKISGLVELSVFLVRSSVLN